MATREIQLSTLQSKLEEFMIESTVFEYQKYKDTIFVPIYPRAHVEEVIGIDHERRTVTARFVIHLTICLKGQKQKLKKFIRNHLILEFDYNQVIYIPELMMRDNPPYIIQQVIEPTRGEDYVTYRIKGNIQCSAIFDLMFFPYRQIEVINHLVIRSQVYKNYVIKYNAMMLLDSNCNFHQFSPHIINPQFAGYTLLNESADIFTGESKYSMKQRFKKEDILAYLVDFVSQKKSKPDERQAFTPQELAKMIFDMSNSHNIEDNRDRRDNINPEDLNELPPFKHITFKFDMISQKIPYILQNQVPIWMLGVVSLYLFTSKPDLGNRYGNAILILVSMIALLTNFRINNIQHHSITFYQLKIMAVMAVPILLIISTAIDFYSNSDSNLTYFALRSSQIQNPFMLASIIIYTVFFALTLFFFVGMIIYNCRKRRQVQEELKMEKYDAGDLWQNLQDLRWGHPDLFKKIAGLFVKNTDSFKIQEKNVKQVLNSMTERLKKTFKQSRMNQLPLGQSIVSQFNSTSHLPRNPN